AVQGGGPGEMRGRRSSERGKARTAACRRRRQSVLVQPVAVVQDEQDSYSVRLERIEEAIPGPEVITAGLRLRGAPGQIDANPTDPRRRHHLGLLVRVAVELDRDAEIVAGAHRRS